MKLCKDCVWYKPGNGDDGEYDLCTNMTIARIAEKNKKSETRRLIRGSEPKPWHQYGFCEIERGSGLGDSCGPEGRFWEPKNEDIPATTSASLKAEDLDVVAS